MKRQSSIQRRSNETEISLKLVLDGEGHANISTGIGFLNHMLVLFAFHGGFDLSLNCTGDLEVDGHHTVEDIGIVLGKAFNEALGEKKGIKRYATVFLPMDESLAMVSIDISGRPYLHYEVPVLSPFVGDFDTQLAEEFLRAFSLHCGLTLHVKILYGHNTHHVLEAIFKALARALREAVSRELDAGRVPSSKGILD